MSFRHPRLRPFHHSQDPEETMELMSITNVLLIIILVLVIVVLLKKI